MWPDPMDGQRAAHTPGGNAAFHNFHNDFSHILDPNQRRRLALAEIDKVPFGWYHIRAVAVAGAGFFADSYDLFAINFAIQLLGISFWQNSGGSIPVNLQTAIKASTSAGAIIGQVIFGWMADRIGRKKMYGVELIILIIATLGQSLSSPSSGLTISGLLIFGRVMMGLGIGGDYPMSAVITSE
jgi:PHS family inorganic phosphate transporter-like MFS transporter